jgi:hypoxanthine phosphoribosyltransferase
MTRSAVLPENFRQLYSREDIDRRIEELLPVITEWAETTWRRMGKALVVAPVLRGGIYFYTDLVQRMTVPLELGVVKAATYDSATKARLLTGGTIDVSGVEAAGRSVLLVDEICDSGRTLMMLSKALLDSGAREVRSIVLVRRATQTVAFTPTWSCFEYPGEEWLVGCGMHDKGIWRNLPEIYAIQGRA